MEVLRGKILSVMRRRALSDWGVAELLADGHDKPVKIVGTIGSPEAGQSVIVHGTWKSHPTYGTQFAVEELVPDVPKDRFAIHKWLMAVGELTTRQASSLIDAYKERLFEVLQHEWQNVHQLHKIKLENVTKLHKAASEMVSKRDVFIQGMNLGFKAGELGILWRRYFNPTLLSVDEDEHQEAIVAMWRAITTDPWILFFDYYFPFRRVASIAKEWKHDAKDQKRVAASMVEALREFTRDGHVGAPMKDVVDTGDALLYGEAAHTIQRAAFDEALEWLIQKKYVVRHDDTYVLLRYLDDAEARIASNVALLLAQKRMIDEHRSIEGSGSSSTAHPE